MQSVIVIWAQLGSDLNSDHHLHIILLMLHVCISQLTSKEIMTKFVHVVKQSQDAYEAKWVLPKMD